MDPYTRTTSHHIPGAPVEDPEAQALIDAMAAEPKSDSLPTQAALVIPTVNHLVNGMARDNIVPDGPGTYAEDLAVGPL